MLAGIYLHWVRVWNGDGENKVPAFVRRVLKCVRCQDRYSTAHLESTDDRLPTVHFVWVGYRYSHTRFVQSSADLCELELSEKSPHPDARERGRTA